MPERPGPERRDVFGEDERRGWGVVDVCIVVAAAAWLILALCVRERASLWRYEGVVAGCQVYEHRWTLRLRLDCPPVEGRHV